MSSFRLCVCAFVWVCVCFGWWWFWFVFGFCLVGSSFVSFVCGLAIVCLWYCLDLIVVCLNVWFVLFIFGLCFPQSLFCSINVWSSFAWKFVLFYLCRGSRLFRLSVITLVFGFLAVCLGLFLVVSCFLRFLRVVFSTNNLFVSLFFGIFDCPPLAYPCLR